MKLFNLYKIQKATTTSREFFINDDGIKCVHYGDIYKNYSFRFIKSSKIINTFSKEVKNSMILKEDSIIIPDVTETVSDYGHPTYIKYDGVPYINGTHALAITSAGGNLKYLFYYLQNPSNIKRLQSLLLGSTVFGISIKDFENFELINYKEANSCQQHIVDIIGSIDNKIENNNKIISNLLKLGDLIQLKSNCKLIDCNALKFNYGKSIPKNNRNSGKFKLFSSNGITDTINESNSHGCSIIFGCRGTIGTVSYSYDDCFVLNTAMYINCDEKDIGKLFFAIRQKKGFVDCATGAVQLQITINEINKERIKISNNDDLNIILRFINNIYMENEKLKDLKQNYLLKFFQ